MIATRYPCALTGSALSLALLLGAASPASAQPYPNNSAAIDQQLQQMVGLFPSMSPQQFLHWQNAMNQMLLSMPNDPNRNNAYWQNAQNNPWGNPTANANTTRNQNMTPFNAPYQQNSLFPGRPGIAQNATGFGTNQMARMPNQPSVNQQQFASGAGSQGGNGNCQANRAAVGAASANRSQQQAAAHHHHHKK